MNMNMNMIVSVTTTDDDDGLTQTETTMNPLAVLIIDRHGHGTTVVSSEFSDAQMIAALLSLAERMSITL